MQQLYFRFLRRFEKYQQGSVTFANDWHTIPQRVGINSFALLGGLLGFAEWKSRRGLEGFMHFLADCASLRCIVLASPWQPSYHHQRFNDQDLYNIYHDPTCFSGPTMPSQYYHSICPSRPYNISFSGYLLVCAFRLRFLAHGRPSRQLTHNPPMLKPSYQELQSLHVAAMVPLGRLPMELYQGTSCNWAAQTHSDYIFVQQQQLQDITNFIQRAI
jgi:hypothetical protein